MESLVSTNQNASSNSPANHQNRDQSSPTNQNRSTLRQHHYDEFRLVRLFDCRQTRSADSTPILFRRLCSTSNNIFGCNLSGSCASSQKMDNETDDRHSPSPPYLYTSKENVGASTSSSAKEQTSLVKDKDDMSPTTFQLISSNKRQKIWRNIKKLHFRPKSVGDSQESEYCLSCDEKDHSIEGTLMSEIQSGTSSIQNSSSSNFVKQSDVIKFLKGSKFGKSPKKGNLRTNTESVIPSHPSQQQKQHRSSANSTAQAGTVVTKSWGPTGLTIANHHRQVEFAAAAAAAVSNKNLEVEKQVNGGFNNKSDEKNKKALPAAGKIIDFHKEAAPETSAVVQYGMPASTVSCFIDAAATTTTTTTCIISTEEPFMATTGANIGGKVSNSAGIIVVGGRVVTTTTTINTTNTKQQDRKSAIPPVVRQSTFDSIHSTVSEMLRQELGGVDQENSEEAESPPPPPSLRRSSYLLNIHLKEGRELVVRDASGSSDPYVKFKYKNKLIYKSNIIFKNLNPYWDERVAHLIDDLSAPLNIEVFDYDRFALDDFMGSASLDLSQFILNQTFDVKVLLGSSGSDEYMGYLLIQISLSHLTSDEQLTFSKKSARVSPESSGTHSKKSKTGQSWSSVVNIVLVEAKELHSTDVQANNLLPDPYVRFKLGLDKHKSKVIPKTTTPKWLEQFDMHIFDDQSSLLEIMVFDKRKDTCMGKCSVNLSEMDREKTHHQWYDLEENCGKIFLLISISGTSSSTVNKVLDMNIDESSKTIDRQGLIERYSLKNSFRHLRDVGHLTVKVYKAQGLAAADIGGKSDPFCVLELVNARLQTHTEYKTLSPEWNKAFTFNVKDINSVLEITVYDEDPNRKFEFLGKIAIPLLKMRNNERRWFALKDAKLQRRAKGKILLEFEIYWNPIRSAVRSVNPKERKYIVQEDKFKRQIFMRNAMRVKSMIMEIMDVGAFVQSCWAWESPTRSTIAFIIFVLGTYFAELYMLPVVLLLLFVRGYMYRSVAESLRLKGSLAEDYAASESDDDVPGDKEEKVGIKKRLIAVQDTLIMVQNALDYIASTMERVKNTFNFAAPFLSILAITVICIITVILYILPLRWLILAWGINKFTKKLRNPHAVPNNELLDFLSRVPSDDEIRKYSEFRPDPLGPVLSTSSSQMNKKKKP